MGVLLPGGEVRMLVCVGLLNPAGAGTIAYHCSVCDIEDLFQRSKLIDDDSGFCGIYLFCQLINKKIIFL